MKIITILGTRPEIIRLSIIIGKLDRICDHLLIHTGQNYDTELSDIFISQLKIRPPDDYFGVKSDNFSEQIGKILMRSEEIFRRIKPDRLLVLGDTNSALSAIVAKRMGISVYHMEAGNRCYDDRVPEEVNRRIIDHCSDILMPYTERSRANLLREGIENNRIFITGNPIYEILDYYRTDIVESTILEKLSLRKNQYFLVTCHRQENVDNPNRLNSIVEGLFLLINEFNKPIILSCHPRTRKRIENLGLEFNNPLLQIHAPFGFFDFVKLEENSLCVLTDSGTVQEECCIFKVPNVTIRDVTERPETIECGSNILSGVDPGMILQSTRTALEINRSWKAPREYLEKNVSDKSIKIITGYTTNPCC